MAVVGSNARGDSEGRGVTTGSAVRESIVSVGAGKACDAGGRETDRFSFVVFDGVGRTFDWMFFEKAMGASGVAETGAAR